MVLFDGGDLVLGLKEVCLAASELARWTVDIKLLLVHEHKKLVLENSGPCVVDTEGHGRISELTLGVFIGHWRKKTFFMRKFLLVL